MPSWLLDWLAGWLAGWLAVGCGVVLCGAVVGCYGSSGPRKQALYPLANSCGSRRRSTQHDGAVSTWRAPLLNKARPTRAASHDTPQPLGVSCCIVLCCVEFSVDCALRAELS